MFFLLLLCNLIGSVFLIFLSEPLYIFSWIHLPITFIIECLKQVEPAFYSVPERLCSLTRENKPKQVSWPWLHSNRISAKGRQGVIKLFFFPPWVYDSKFKWWIPNPQNLRMWLFGDRVFKVVIKVKWSHMGGTNLIWLAYKKRILRPRQIQREDHVKTQGENIHLQAKETGLRRHDPCWHLDPVLVAFRTGRKFLWLMPPTLWCRVYQL